MEDKIIMIDTSILIDFYRKTDKTNAVWIKLVKEGYQFSISAITKYEIFAGATQSQLEFWNNVLQAITSFGFNPSLDYLTAFVKTVSFSTTSITARPFHLLMVFFLSSKGFALFSKSKI